MLNLYFKNEKKKKIVSDRVHARLSAIAYYVLWIGRLQGKVKI